MKNPLNYVFIVGCARSGTSILGELIAAHPDVNYFFEQHTLWEAGGLGENGSHRLGEVHATPAVKAHIRSWFEAHTDNKKVQLEKNPRNLLRIPYVKAIFPEAKLIHIVRDGRDAACSMVSGCGGIEWRHLKPPDWKEYYERYQGALRCAYTWKQSLEIGLADLKSVAHLQIRFEDLVDSPAVLADEIFSYLGLDLHPQVTEFSKLIRSETSESYHARVQTRWYQDNHKQRVGRWRENLSLSEQQQITRLLHPLLVELGYEK